MQLCASLQLALQQVTPNAFSLDLYYLAFPNDRRFIKYLVYGIYVIEFVQTMLISHDVFATFGYGFGDMDALTANNLSWFTVPIMSAVGARSNSYPFSVTYLEFSCWCGASLLCIQNLHIVEVTNHPDIHHLCSLLCSFSVALSLIYLQISLINSVASIFTGIYVFQADIIAKTNTRKMHVAAGGV